MEHDGVTLAAPRRSRVAAHARFFVDAIRTNLLIALEYRVSLFSQVFGMLLNDIIWIVFWALFFQRFPVPNWRCRMCCHVGHYRAPASDWPWASSAT